MMRALLATLLLLPACAHAPAAVPVEAYEWRQIRSIPPSVLAAELPAFRRFGGTGVALDISAVVDISEIADPAERAEQQVRFRARLTAYVKAAAANGLSVKALAGSPNWVLPQVRYVNDVLVDFVAAFNAEAPAEQRLLGLVLDLEPWAASSWEAEKAEQTRYLIDTVHQVAERAGELPVTVTLPYWLDGTAAPQSVLYQGVTMSPTQHVIRILDAASPRHSVAVMAYRDTTGGADGSLAVVAREFDLADQYRGRVGVVIAQEISDVAPARITFFQEGPAALQAAMGELSSHYGGRAGFGGFLVNDLAALVAKL